MKRLITLPLLCIVLLTGSCQYKSIDEYIQKQYLDGELNGNILVVRGDTILYENSFGIAHPKTKEPLTAAHRFNVGSIYKEFPGVAIMQLFEKGRLKLDDKVSYYLNDLPVWASSIGIKQLFKYTSGLPKVPWDNYIGSNNPITEELVLNDLRKEELVFEPGSDYLYSNYNPLLLTLIVEKVTGRSFEDYVQEHIFEAAKMTDSYFAKQTPYKDEKSPAVAFDVDFNLDSYLIQEPKFLMSFTTQDLYQWLYHLHNHQIISKESVKLLSERAGAQSPLGVLEWDNDTLEVHHHHGESGNYEAVIRYYPKDDLYIVILKNQKYENVSDMADNIHRILR
ncbi:serine hydrolase domain-containing protein [Flagellimonas meridianipacifica]|uniref:CubicO group peptidase (Beta-lactamase class C family) n=1 Tax=Flagellimonas meridianipacifica TaxID=1080225 RepID=A0A2T0MB31_9FLAO|nr:serine hydrolase domain-containing protein [Allomuricauda pacifica]PRX54622.1 CubicO group peptidase (beta-lactamase class C family) [Allomuricauda pacifica]